MNAIPKKSTLLETIFDHGITDAEQMELFSDIESYDEYVEFMSTDDLYRDIFYLYHLRGDTVMANRYFNKMSDSARHSLKMTCCEKHQ